MRHENQGDLHRRAHGVVVRSRLFSYPRAPSLLRDHYLQGRVSFEPAESEVNCRANAAGVASLVATSNVLPRW
jgi:hypothetical protein